MSFITERHWIAEFVHSCPTCPVLRCVKAVSRSSGRCHRDGRRAVRSPSGASYPQSGGSPNPLILYGTPARHGRVFIASLLSCRAGLAAYAVGPPMLPWPRKACASTPPRPAGSLQYRQNHSSATFKHYKYVYDYDRMGRLLGVDFRRSEQGGWTNASTFDVSELSYDANGNLLKLKRRPNTGGYIDNLSFAYTSGTNKLNILTDAAGALASWDASTMLYAYDQSDLPGGIRALAHRLPDL